MGRAVVQARAEAGMDGVMGRVALCPPKTQSEGNPHQDMLRPWTKVLVTPLPGPGASTRVEFQPSLYGALGATAFFDFLALLTLPHPHLCFYDFAPCLALVLGFCLPGLCSETV